MKKRIYLSLLVMVLGWNQLPVLIYSRTSRHDNPQSVRMLGDINDDGIINIVDALILAQFYTGLDPAGFNHNTADVDYDGICSIVDALLIARYCVGLEQAFPAGTVYIDFQLQLDMKRHEWAAVQQGIYNYIYTVTDPGSGVQLQYQVFVEGMDVVKVVDGRTGLPLPEPENINFFSVDQLLDLFQLAINQKYLAPGTQAGTDPLQLEIFAISPGSVPLLIYFPYQFKLYWLTMF